MAHATVVTPTKYPDMMKSIREYGYVKQKIKKKNNCHANFSILETELEQAFNIALKEVLQDGSILNDLMISIAEALDETKVSEQLVKLDEELNQHRKRLHELMQLQMNSLQARKFVNEEIQEIMRKSEFLQAERDKLLSNMERSNLDQKRLDELRGFINDNSPLDQFDKDLFRKVIRYAVVHNRYEIEFMFFTGISKRVAIVSEKSGKSYAPKRHHSGYAEDMRIRQAKMHNKTIKPLCGGL